MTLHVPIPDYSAARQAMVDSQLRPQGVNDPAVIAAMGKVARERFVPEQARPLAYADRAIPIGGGRHLAAPTTLGMLLTALAPRPGERALVVAAAGGYSAAVLAEIGVDVVAVESAPELATLARDNGADIIEGQLEAGHKAGAPYDLVLIDGAVEHVPDAIVDQIAEGGRIGLALVDRGVTRLMHGRKAGGGLGLHSISDAGVPALPGFQRPRAFTF